MKKILSLILIMTMLLSCAAFAEITLAPGGETPICSETVSLTIAVPDDLLIEDYETTVMTQMLEEMGNYDLTFVILPSTDYITKLNLMVQSGEELPDIIFGTEYSYPSNAMVYSWAMNGAIIPLTEYVKDPDTAFYFTQAIERVGMPVLGMSTMPDGEIYYLPSINQAYANASPIKFFIYEPWLEQLGMEAPTTTEEFYALLKAAQGIDFNGNGKADEVLMAGDFGSIYNDVSEILMNAFVYAGDPNYFTVDDGVLGFAYTTDEWKEGLKFIRKLFEEGLIPMDALTMDGEQLRTLINQEDNTAFVYAANWLGNFNSTNPNKDNFTFFEPLVGPNGVQYTTYTAVAPKGTFFITADCDPEKVEAAFRLGDLMLSKDFSIITRFGEMGVDWDYYENVPNPEDFVCTYENFDISIVTFNQTFWSDEQNKALRQTGPYMREYSIAGGIGKLPEAVTQDVWTNSASQTAYNTGGFWPAETIPVLIYTEDELAIVNDRLLALNDYVLETTAAFLAGNMDIDAEWDAFQAELAAIGTAEVLEVAQVVYDRMYK